MTTLAAWTAMDPVYPAFLNFTRDGDEVVVTARGHATPVSGVRVCGQTCHPGDENCNNYCNSAPDKGPMADSPLPHNFERDGPTVQIRMSVGALDALLKELNDQ